MLIEDILKKPYARLVIRDGESGFVAEIVEFPGCFAVGETAAEALENLDAAVSDWVGAAIAQGQGIPEPLDTAGYSGKLVLRMPKSLHQRAAFWADRDGVSLNQFIVSCVAEHVGAKAAPPSRFQHININAAVAQVSVTAHPSPGVVTSGPFSRNSAKTGEFQMTAILPQLRELTHA